MEGDFYKGAYIELEKPTPITLDMRVSELEENFKDADERLDAIEGYHSDEQQRMKECACECTELVSYNPTWSFIKIAFGVALLVYGGIELIKWFSISH